MMKVKNQKASQIMKVNPILNPRLRETLFYGHNGNKNNMKLNDIDYIHCTRF